jgi:hypothetical protein
MNNNQRKLFNVANKIEKLLYDGGVNEFYKTTTYYSITICLYKKQLGNTFIKQLNNIIETNNNLDMSIFVDNDGYLKLEIW